MDKRVLNVPVAASPNGEANLQVTLLQLQQVECLRKGTSSQRTFTGAIIFFACSSLAVRVIKGPAAAQQIP